MVMGKPGFSQGSNHMDMQFTPVLTMLKVKLMAPYTIASCNTLRQKGITANPTAWAHGSKVAARQRHSRRHGIRHHS
jgi:hypothetical protein